MVKYYLLTRGSNIDEIKENNFNNRFKCINQVIGACVDIGNGLQASDKTISIIRFNVQWLSRKELFFLRLIWALPISMSNSCSVARGVSDREILNYPTSTFVLIIWLVSVL